MRRDDAVRRWTQTAATFRASQATVDGAALCEQFVIDLESLDQDGSDDALTVAEAAEYSGFSAAHIRRLVNDGKLSANGRAHARRVRRGDLPRKPRVLASAAPNMHVLPAKAEQAVRESVGVSKGIPR